MALAHEETGGADDTGEFLFGEGVQAKWGTSGGALGKWSRFGDSGKRKPGSAAAAGAAAVAAALAGIGGAASPAPSSEEGAGAAGDAAGDAAPAGAGGCNGAAGGGVPIKMFPRRKLGDSVFPIKGRPPITVDIEALQPLFIMPQPEAAKALGISLTSLKMTCRRLGIHRWPYQRCARTRDIMESGMNSYDASEVDESAASSRSASTVPPGAEVAAMRVHEGRPLFTKQAGFQNLRAPAGDVTDTKSCPPIPQLNQYAVDVNVPNGPYQHSGHIRGCLATAQARVDESLDCESSTNCMNGLSLNGSWNSIGNGQALGNSWGYSNSGDKRLSCAAPPHGASLGQISESLRMDEDSPWMDEDAVNSVFDAIDAVHGTGMQECASGEPLGMGGGKNVHLSGASFQQNFVPNRSGHQLLHEQSFNNNPISSQVGHFGSDRGFDSFSMQAGMMGGQNFMGLQDDGMHRRQQMMGLQQQQQQVLREQSVTNNNQLSNQISNQSSLFGGNDVVLQQQQLSQQLQQQQQQQQQQLQLLQQQLLRQQQNNIRGGFETASNPNNFAQGQAHGSWSMTN